MEREVAGVGAVGVADKPSVRAKQKIPFVERVLIGSWDSAKKIVESQSPRGWDERIIKTINGKILPKLTPEQLAQVAKHHVAIENAALVAGITISTAEMYTVFLLAGLEANHLIRLHNINRYENAFRKTLDIDWFKGLHEAAGKMKVSEAGFSAMAGTLLVLISRIQDENSPSPAKGKNKAGPSTEHTSSVSSILSALHSPKEAEQALRSLYTEAVKTKEQREGHLYGRPVPTDQELTTLSRESFADYKKVGFWGVEGVLNFAKVDDPGIRSIFHRLQGVRTSTEHSGKNIFGKKTVLPDGTVISVEPTQTDIDADALTRLRKSTGSGNSNFPGDARDTYRKKTK